MIVELLGPPGAGKTALLPATVDVMSRWTGRETLTAEVAIERTLTKVASAKFLGAVVGRGARRRRAIIVDLPHGLAFVLSNPRLSTLVGRGILRAPVGWGHRWTLYSRWVGVAARQRFLRRHLRDFVVVFDEGLYHRAVNLFAWRELSSDGRTSAKETRDVLRYVALTPAPDLAIFIDVDEQVAGDRVHRRGLPVRLREHSASEATAFLRAATRIVRLIPAAASDVPWVRIQNGSTLAVAADSLAHQVNVAMPRPSRGRVWPAEEASHWPMFRRPDRWWRGRSRRLAARERDELTQVARLLGLGEIRRARSVGGGRSWSVVAESDAGTIVVKRYKPTVEDDAIRSEHGVLRRLQALGLPVPRLVVTAEGTTMVRGPAGRYAAYRHVAGYVSAHEILASRSGRHRRTHAFGQALGMLHDALADMAPTARPTTGLDRFGSRVDSSPAHAARLATASEIGGRHLGDRVEELDELLQAANLEATHIHGDYGPYNILVRPGRRLFIIDFELARLDWRLVDLVTALPRFAVSRAGLSLARFDAFLDGYFEVNPRLRSEMPLAPAVLEFLSLRRASVCLVRHEKSHHDPRWMREARARIGTARALAAGEHPLVAPLVRRAS
ncbi:MAG: phosphotransferase enzyme family protein [Candidatus Limnocylindria bacterium]